MAGRKPAAPLFVAPPEAAPPARTDRALCPVCGRQAYTKTDGSVRTHKGRAAGVRCPGVPAPS